MVRDASQLPLAKPCDFAPSDVIAGNGACRAVRARHRECAIEREAKAPVPQQAAALRTTERNLAPPPATIECDLLLFTKLDVSMHSVLLLQQTFERAKRGQRDCTLASRIAYRGRQDQALPSTRRASGHG